MEGKRGRPRGRPRKSDSNDGSGRKRAFEDDDSYPNKHLKYTPDPVILERTNNTGKIHKDFTCKLGFDNEDGTTEYCLMQLATFKDRIIFFTRSGPNNEPGKWTAKREPSIKDAERNFKKIFREKTDNGWSEKDNFKPCDGKYYILNLTGALIDDDSDNDSNKKNGSGDEADPDVEIDDRTALLLKLIFSREMFSEQISSLKLHERRLRPEKLSDRVFDKAENAFSEIEKGIKLRKSSREMAELWDNFYQAVPHQDSEGENMVPTSIEHASALLIKKQASVETLECIKSMWDYLDEVGDDDLEPNELYQLLNCNLRLIEKGSEEFQLIKEYAESCKNSRPCVLLDVWRVHRNGDNSYEEFLNIDYRKLLWYGVNVANVASILKEGLQISRFTSGNLGRGIHLSPDHAGSSWNVGIHWGSYCGEKNVGFMFLVEGALGRIKYVKMGNLSIKQAPDAFNCIGAKGRLEPDASKDQVRTFGGKRVIIPLGTPAPQKDFESSGFLRTEYVLYNPGQMRLRYLAKFSFDKNLAKKTKSRPQ